MAAVVAKKKLELVILTPEEAHTLQTNHQRFTIKTESSTLHLPHTTIVNWNHSRVVTPGQLCGCQTSNGLKYFSFEGDDRIELYRSGNDSQGLIFTDANDSAAATSVTTSIKTKTTRKNERKGTYIQYDKDRVIQSQDFPIDPRNYRDRANYEGGHLIDHKFTAEGSHYVERNYIPEHYFYNSPLKEHLVKKCGSYVEVPLYTTNPPQIGVKDQRDKYHSVPIGIILVQINQNHIDGVYYFPNNYDYKGLKDRLGIKKNLAKTITPYFKLKRSLYQLLLPAIMFDLKSMINGEQQQMQTEKAFFNLIDDISAGMASAESPDDQYDISKLSFNVLHEAGVDPGLYLNSDQLRNDPSLIPAFNRLGKFLVEYGIQNALKSETLSINSRLVILNVIIDFFDVYYGNVVRDEAFDHIDTLNKQFRSTLRELHEISQTMNKEELVFLGNTYARLSNVFNFAFSFEGYAIFNDKDFLNYLRKSAQTIKIFIEKQWITNLNKDQSWNFISIIRNLQESLNHLIEIGYLKSEFQEEIDILISLRDPSLELLQKLTSGRGGVNVQFQTNIDRGTRLRTSTGFLQSILGNLGSFDDDSSDS